MSIMHVESSAAVVATAEESRCRHLSGSYKGICAYSLSCYFVCKDESRDNVDGSCDWLQCWCYTNCGTPRRLRLFLLALLPSSHESSFHKAKTTVRTPSQYTYDVLYIYLI